MASPLWYNPIPHGKRSSNTPNISDDPSQIRQKQVNQKHKERAKNVYKIHPGAQENSIQAYPKGESKDIPLQMQKYAKQLHKTHAPDLKNR